MHATSKSKAKREQLKYKFKKFIFGSKDTEGAGKLALVYLLLISIGFIYLYPVLYMVSKSFMNLNDLLDTSINWIPSQLYMENYKQAFKSMDFWKTFKDSILIAGIPTLINVVICSIVGYGFARYEFKGKKLMLGLLIFSFILPPQATMMPTYVFYTDIGLINSLKAFVVPALFGQGLKAQIFILIFYNFFRQVPKVLIEAAKIDGAGHFKAFMRIALPSAAPAILVVFLFSIVWYWNEAYLTQLYVVGAFASKTDTYHWSSLIVSLKNFENSYNTARSVPGSGMVDINESIKMAGTMLSILPLLIMYLVLQKQFVESVDRTGITGE
ncbi:MAG: carbohydrate ABC transporter permease [Lachnospiraceae bacterium]|nr:carbohydrate ABC transporter permease [Lachnospiraceae bacterium]